MTTASARPSRMLRASYLFLMLVALFTAFRLIFEVLEPSAPLASRVLAGTGGVSVALLLWPWPDSRLRVTHIARVASGVAFGVALFVFPIQLDQGDGRTQALNAGLMGIALVLHGLVVLLASEVIRLANDKDQEDLLVTCRKVQGRLVRLELKLDERDQALASEMHSLTAAVDRLGTLGTVNRSWVRRLRQLL